MYVLDRANTTRKSSMSDDEIVTIVLSSLIALGIGLFIRYGLKPKFEIIFDDNRKANFLILFNGIQAFDSQFLSFYEILEDRMGLLRRDRREIIPRMQFASLTPESIHSQTRVDFGEISRLTSEYDEVRRNLQSILQAMRDNYDAFLKDYKLFLNYMHDTFLRDVSLYLWNTIYYSEWLLRDENLVMIADKRLELAFKIIQYLEEDGSIKMKIQNMDNFVKKWKDYKSQN